MRGTHLAASLVLICATCMAQNPKSHLLTPDILVTSDIPREWAAVFRDIYLGNLYSRTDETNDVERGALLASYLREYGPTCPKYVPKDGVELTNKDCGTTLRTTYRVGYYTENCIRYNTVPSGSFADRNLSSLLPPLDAALVRGITSTPPMEALQGNIPALNVSVAIRSATEKLVHENGCESAALRRYQDNLVRLIRYADPLPITERAYEAPINPSSSSPLPLTSTTRAVYPPTNVPSWIKPQRDPLATLLRPDDRPKFNQIMDSLVDDIGTQRWKSAYEELYRLRKLEKQYNCYSNDNSGCKAKAQLEDYEYELEQLLDKAPPPQPPPFVYSPNSHSPSSQH